MQHKVTRADRRAVQDQQRQAKAMAQMSKQRCEIFMVRHGETEWNTIGRLQGSLPPGPPISRRGAAQAEALARALEGQPFDVVYTSDLLRTQQTVAILMDRLPGPPQVQLCPELRERHLGVLAGFTCAEAAQQHPAAFAALSSHKPNEAIDGGGESLNALSSRVVAALEQIAGRHPGERVVVCTHGGVHHAAYRRATGNAARNVPPCSLSVLRIDASLQPVQWAVGVWADTAHLNAAGYESAAFGGGAGG